jgi:hypothetical protein
MASVLEVVQRSKGDQLAPGEQYLAAAVVERKTGFFGGIPVVLLATVAAREHPPQITLPESMIWAATNQRLFIWSSDALTRKKPKKLIGAFPYRSELHWIRADDKSKVKGAPAGKTYLTIGLRGVEVPTEVKVTDAYALAQSVQEHLGQPPPPTPAM